MLAHGPRCFAREWIERVAGERRVVGAGQLVLGFRLEHLDERGCIELATMSLGEGMNYGRKEGMKTKVSVSIPRDLLEEIDAEAAQTSRSRSQIFEVWLRLAARRRAAAKLERDTLAYYTSRTAEQEAEDEALSRASPPDLAPRLAIGGPR
jgi:hypothetical protein